MKKLKILLIILMFLPTLFIFSACSETITDFKIENYKTQFNLYEEYKLGDAKISKLVNNKWKNVKLEEIQIVSSNYDKYNVGEYEVVVKHKDFDKTITLTVNVIKIQPDFEPISHVNAIYGQTLSQVGLPENYEWLDENLTVGDVTNFIGRKFDAIFNKGPNYLPVTGKVTVVVGKADTTFEPIDNLYATYLQSLYEISLPEGYAWQNPNDMVGNATQIGNQHNVIYTKSSNYNPVVGTVNVIVAKRFSTVTPTYQAGTLRYGDKFPTLTLAEFDTPGSINWKTGQTIKLGAHEYEWEYTPTDSSFTTQTGKIRLTATEKIVEVPQAITLTYNGNLQSVLQTYTNDLWEIVQGETSATEVGTYSITLSLKDKTNCIWSNGFKLDIVVNWHIIQNSSV